MDARLLFAMMGFAFGIDPLTAKGETLIRVVSEPKFTKYLWGDISDISGKALRVLDTSVEGDCLCVTTKGLVDVDHRDLSQDQSAFFL